MKYMIYTLVVALISITFWNWQVEGSSQSLALERAKQSVIRSAHDASLQINRHRLLEGSLEFNQAIATEVFSNSLQRNMQLDENLVPKPNTFYRQPIEIVHAAFYDDSNVGNYPYFVHVETDDYLIAEHINGPAVLFVIKTQNPFTTYSEALYIYVSAIYEYPEF